MSNEKLVLLFGSLRNYLISILDKDTERKIFIRRLIPYTMVSYQRLSHLWNLVNVVEKEKIPGNFVECGVWKGGSAAILAYLSQKHGSKRQIHLFDSFAGMPEPTLSDGKRAVIFSDGKNSGKLTTINKTIGTTKEVKELLFSKLKLNKQNIILHKGWFQATIPENKKMIGKIAILRIDADWYESVKICLEQLYVSSKSKCSRKM
jgi:hypothetical protein